MFEAAHAELSAEDAQRLEDVISNQPDETQREIIREAQKNNANDFPNTSPEGDYISVW